MPAEHIAGWMLYALLVGSVVIVSAIAAHDAQRAANRPVRFIWLGAIVAIVAISALAPLRESTAVVTLPASLEPSTFQPIAYTTADRWALPTWIRSARDLAAAPFTAVMTVSKGPLERLPVDVHRLLGLGWLIASMATLGVFVLSYRRSRRRMQQWPVRQIGDTAARVSPAIGPAVIGLAPAEIIVPSWLLQRPLEEQRLVLTHEVEHVRARDPWVLVIACAAVAVMPWHPALWYALGRLRLAVELDCDRRVLRQGIPAASYGALLIDLSALRTALPSAMPAFTCSGSYLERRLVAMTARRSRFATSRRALGAIIAVAALVTACESKLPTSAEINAMDATTAAAKASEVELFDESKAAYVVDDKVVSAQVAKAIPAEEIAEVRIVGKDASGTGEIRLRTKGSLLEKTPDSLVAFYRKSGSEVEVVRGKPIMLEDRDGSTRVMLDKSAGESASTERPRVMLKKSPYRTTFDGLLLVDGQPMASGDLNRIDPESIATIEVVKGDAAKTRYTDPRAANGVIVVTTKAKK